MYKVRIVRETSPYNKYIKWFTKGESKNGAKFTFGYKTEREARESVSDTKLHTIID